MSVQDNKTNNDNQLEKKVGDDEINSKIKKVKFSRVEDTTTTVCHIILYNGFVVTQTGGCVDPNGYDKKLGERISYKNAIAEVKRLFAFYKREKKYNINQKKQKKNK